MRSRARDTHTHTHTLTNLLLVTRYEQHASRGVVAPHPNKTNKTNAPPVLLSLFFLPPRPTPQSIYQHHIAFRPIEIYPPTIHSKQHSASSLPASIPRRRRPHTHTHTHTQLCILLFSTLPSTLPAHPPTPSSHHRQPAYIIISTDITSALPNLPLPSVLSYSPPACRLHPSPCSASRPCCSPFPNLTSSTSHPQL